ncbi:hypothetical protein TWF694_004572 [Orbilia ellipsospora]|uniref:C2H2-type domain-containing protein n=1 Tax=Orbilia ellipsospora TaxID=2528407 RepID=A0AAV9WWU6_9PEZI
MPDATTTTTTTSTATTPSILSTSTNHVCNSCQISFQSSQEQRSHMKEPWHISNLKRKIESLPPLSREEFETQSQPETTASQSKSTRTHKSKQRSRSPSRTRPTIAEAHISSPEDSNEDEDEEEAELQFASPFQCLFCNHYSPSRDDGFTQNLDHMTATHNFTLPDIEMIEDIQSLISYLSTEVRIWHECLYCGATKPSTDSIQSHMRDKNHCVLNLDREPELLDFWEPLASVDSEEEEGTVEEPVNISITEMRGASGRVIGSKHHSAPSAKKSRKRTSPTTGALPSTTTDNENNAQPPAESSVLIQAVPPIEPPLQTSGSRQLARREEMSIAGLSPHQRQALVLAEKKARRSEDIARRAREWVYARAANTQKHDQIDGTGKWGKQNHKLQPR